MSGTVTQLSRLSRSNNYSFNKRRLYRLLWTVATPLASIIGWSEDVFEERNAVGE